MNFSNPRISEGQRKKMGGGGGTKKKNFTKDTSLSDLQTPGLEKRGGRQPCALELQVRRLQAHYPHLYLPAWDAREVGQEVVLVHQVSRSRMVLPSPTPSPLPLPQFLCFLCTAWAPAASRYCLLHRGS